MVLALLIRLIYVIVNTSLLIHYPAFAICTLFYKIVEVYSAHIMARNSGHARASCMLTWRNSGHANILNRYLK